MSELADLSFEERNLLLNEAYALSISRELALKHAVASSPGESASCIIAKAEVFLTFLSEPPHQLQADQG